MYVKRMVSAAAIATGVGMSAVTFGVGLVNAAPLDPPPSCPNRQGVPGGPVNNPTPPPPYPAIRIPCTGPGGARGGGGQPVCESGQ